MLCKSKDFDKEDFKTHFKGQNIMWLLRFKAIKIGIKEILELSNENREVLFNTYCEDLDFASGIEKRVFKFNYPSLPNDVKKVAKPFFTALYDDILGGASGIRMKGLSVTNLKRENVRKGFFKANKKEYGLNATCPACLGDMGMVSDDGYADLDHYFTKSLYPMLSISADNLIPVCKVCNTTGVKGSKNPLNDYQHPGGLLNIFLPYHRPGIDYIQIKMDSVKANERICLESKTNEEINKNRIKNTEWLFNLNERWSGRINSSINDNLINAVEISLNEDEIITEELVRNKLSKVSNQFLKSKYIVPDMWLSAEYARLLLNSPTKFKSFYFRILENSTTL
ncbi:hypothetical protein [Peribacillus frigoritolerans]